MGVFLPQSWVYLNSIEQIRYLHYLLKTPTYGWVGVFSIASGSV